MAGYLDVDTALGEGSSFLHRTLSIGSGVKPDDSININFISLPSGSLMSTPVRNFSPLITPPPELRRRQTAQDCSNSIVAEVNAATVAASRILQQASATFEQALSQASINASAAAQQASASASASVAIASAQAAATDSAASVTRSIDPATNVSGFSLVLATSKEQVNH